MSGPVPIGSNDWDPASFREAHALDRCECGHPRTDHYGRDGASGRCLRCICPAYGMAEEVAR